MSDGTLIDTDVFIDHFRGAHALRSPPHGRVAYSVVTRCELFSGRRVDEDRVREVLDSIHEIPVDRHVAEQAGRLRRELGIRTPDAIIAASALTQGLTLLTSNVRDFEAVPGLKIRKSRG
jgi:predicted nucleic acid-binding protein